jgi:hypothetical protein
MTNLVREPTRQLELFEEDPGAAEQARRRAEVSDAIREKLGDAAITRGRLVDRPRRRPLR